MTVQYLSQLPVGSKVKFGRLVFNNEPIEWTVVAKNHNDPNYPAESVTLLTDKIIKFLAFDAKEEGNADSNRANFGNNRYRLSNIRQWLNSYLGASEWFIPQNINGMYHFTDRDAAPTDENIYITTFNTGYNNVNGFLSSFYEFERNFILDTKVKTTTVPDFDYQPTFENYDVTTDKFYLLSSDEIGMSSGANEGATLEYFINNSFNAQATSYAYSSSPFSTAGAYLSGIRSYSILPWMLRSPVTTSTHEIYRAGEGKLSKSTAYNYHGLRPATNLKYNTLVKDTGDGVYEVIDNVPPRVEIIKNSFLDVEFKASDMVNEVAKVEIYFNGELLQEITEGFDSNIKFQLPYSKIKEENNVLTFKTTDSANATRTQNFKVSNEIVTTFNIGDRFATANENFEATNVTDNNNGTVTITVSKNLRDTINQGEQVEKVSLNYKPSIFVTNDTFATPNYEEMDFSKLTFNSDNRTVTEEWTKDVEGSYAFTKLDLTRQTHHKDMALSKLSQVFEFKKDL